ncbi:MAG: flagellar basal body rod protein FlgC [Pseudomonadota bacterium]
MSLLNVFDIAGTALSAQTVRLNTTASNMANANSASSSSESTYRARYPVFSTAMLEQWNFDAADHAPRGVRIDGIVESEAALKREYSPNHPLADTDGYITLPNVNVVEEMANMISASRSYQSNIEIMEASKQLLQQTLSLGQ